jgi:hypothetical protein
MKANAQLLRAVRQILSAMPAGKRATAKWITDTINSETPLVTDEDMVEAALIWNQGKGYVTYQHNEESGLDEWELTERGRKHEGVA